MTCTPYLTRKAFTRRHGAFVVHEAAQQAEFVGRELNDLASKLDSSSAKIDASYAVIKDRRRRSRALVGAAEKCLHSVLERPGREGLRDAFICSQANAVRDFFSMSRVL